MQRRDCPSRRPAMQRHKIVTTSMIGQPWTCTTMQRLCLNVDARKTDGERDGERRRSVMLLNCAVMRRTRTMLASRRQPTPIFSILQQYFVNFAVTRRTRTALASYLYRASALTFRLHGSDATVITLAHRQHDGRSTDFF